MTTAGKFVDNIDMNTRLFLIIVLAAAGLSSATAGETVPMLPDQFGNSSGLDDYSGEAVLAIVASTRKLRWIGRWEETIRAEIPELVSIRVADVNDEPPPSFEKLVRILLKRVPENVSVLIDMRNLWATSYALDTSEPCLVLLDGDHNVVAKFRGRPKGQLVDDVMNALRSYFSATDES